MQVFGDEACSSELRYKPSGDGERTTRVLHGAILPPGMLLNIPLCTETPPPPRHPAQCQ